MTGDRWKGILDSIPGTHFPRAAARCRASIGEESRDEICELMSKAVARKQIEVLEEAYEHDMALSYLRGRNDAWNEFMKEDR